MCDQRDLAAGGPVSLRLSSGDEFDDGFVAGPFDYDLNLKEEYDKVKKPAFSEAFDFDWLSVEESRWQLSERLSLEMQTRTTVKEIRLGGSPDQLTTSISYDGQGLSFSLNDISRSVMPVTSDELSVLFEKAVAALGSPARLYVQLVLSDESTTEVRPYSQTSHRRRAINDDVWLPQIAEEQWGLSDGLVIYNLDEIREMRLGPTADDLKYVLVLDSAAAKEDDPLNGKRDGRGSYDSNAHRIYEGFAIALSAMKYPRTLFAQIVFRDGTSSEIRKFELVRGWRPHFGT